MSTDGHKKEKKHTVNWVSIGYISLLTLVFLVFAFLMVKNTWPQQQPGLQELWNQIEVQTTSNQGKHVVEQKTTSKNTIPIFDPWGRVISTEVSTKNASTTTTTSDIPESYVISKENLEKALTAVAYTARKEAQTEYKENFSILLTILTIFGIAWPVIVTIFQSQQGKLETKLNLERFESDLDEMREQENMEFADIAHSSEWFWNFEIEKYNDLIRDKEDEIKQANTNSANPKTIDILEKEKKNLKKSLYALMKNRAKSLMKIIYYYALANKIKQADSKVGSLINFLDSINELIAQKETTETFIVEEIKWDLFVNSGVQNAADIETKFCSILKKKRNNSPE